MAQEPVTKQELETIRRQVELVAANTGVQRGQIMNEIAQRRGYKDWLDLIDHVTDGEGS